MSPTGSPCGRTCSSTPRRRDALGRRGGPLVGPPGAGRRRAGDGDGPLLHHGDRLPLDRQPAGHSRPRQLPRRDLPHRALAPRSGRFHRPAVAAIGTGSSAIQAIPVIARQAAQVTVFQRTANYSIPAHNRPLDPAAVAGIKANYRALREEAKTRFGCFLVDLPRPSALAESPEAREANTNGAGGTAGWPSWRAIRTCCSDPEANDTAADFVRARIRETVDDPETARKLMPTNVIGCKRMWRRYRLFRDLQPPQRPPHRYQRPADPRNCSVRCRD